MVTVTEVNKKSVNLSTLYIGNKVMAPNDKYLDFEKPIVDLTRRIEDLEEFASKKDIDYSDEVARLRSQLAETTRNIFGNLTAWQKVQLARHPQRPVMSDYINLVQDFMELFGDRLYRDDPAIVCGLGRIDDEKVMIIGHQKGRGPREQALHNYGSPHPEGYRKAQHKMKQAEKFGLPVISFIDTPGAFPGVGAEERGIAMSFAVMLEEMSGMRAPIICVVIGEGGSGGALGIGVGDRLLMMEYAYYSVILPEGCSAILWKDPGKKAEASEALKLTAQNLLDQGIVDEIIPEPLGGAHRNYKESGQNVKDAILRNLAELKSMSIEELMKKRYAKLRKIGAFLEGGNPIE